MAEDQKSPKKSRELGLWKLQIRILLGASWPNAITLILLSLRFSSDTYFLGQIGFLHQAAWATGYVMLLMFLSFGMGTLFAVNSLVAKTNGRRWFPASGCYTWQGIWFSVICGSGVLLMYFATPFLMSLFGHDNELRTLEIIYIRIALVSTIFQLVAWAVLHFFIAIHRSFLPMLVAALALVTHVLCNYSLTLGNFGFSQMGIEGAAWSLVISSIVMAFSALLLFTIPKSFRKYHSRLAIPRWSNFKTVVKEGHPIGWRQTIDEFVWNVVLIWIIGQFGPVHLAAAAVLISILDIFILAFDSVGTTSVPLIAKAIGTNKIAKADRWRFSALLVTITYALIAGLGFYIFKEPIIHMFAKDPEQIRLCLALAFIIPIFLLIYATYSTYDHALCATEDNRWPSTVSLICSIVILGGGGVILVLFFFQTNSYGAWTLLLTNVFIVALLFAIRWSRGHWRSKPVPQD